mmetsp:Transcript_49895/g.139192  ORF Transcript_49895/g.139192 Transcript_49895/m.139192 type:complete len:262 (-) Transcript_49895:114-899(-)
MCSSPSTTVSTGSAQDTPARLGVASCRKHCDAAGLYGKGSAGHPPGVHRVRAGGPRAPPAGRGPAAASVAPGLVERVAEAMEGAIRSSASQQARASTLSVFDSSEVPPIPLREYLRRLRATFRCGDAAFVSALVIMDRFLEGPSTVASARRSSQEKGRLTELNAHRLFLACLVLAVKYSEDLTYGNSHYAKAGGVRLREVNRLERCLLIALDYNLRVQPEQFRLYEQALRFGLEDHLAASGTSHAAAWASARAWNCPGHGD